MSGKPIVSALTLKWLLGVLVGLLAYKTAQFCGYFLGDGSLPFVDINAFHVAGRMTLDGLADQTYFAREFLKQQRLVGPPDVFMPWAYPPPFNLICAGLALLPVPVAYFLFTGTTLALYLLVMRRLAGDDLPLVLTASFPALLITLACGQNGLLTGALVGLACLWLLEDRPRAGVPLGLMVIKPHLAVPLALVTVLDGRWRTVAVAAAVVAGACAIATLTLGTSVWAAFLNGTAEAKVFLAEAMYRLYRMVSAYAFVRSLGAPAAFALAAQVLVALALLAMVAHALFRRRPARQVLGLAALASSFISPYAYDYDLCIMGVALALLMPDLRRLMSERGQLALIGLCIAGSGASLLQQSRVEALQSLDPNAPVDFVSLGGVVLLAAVAFVWKTLQREAAVTRPGVITA